jgi:hypothetical protein
MRGAAVFVIVLLVAGCTHQQNSYAALPEEECAVFVDLIGELDDPARLSGLKGTGGAPSSFPAGPRLDTPIDGPSGKADITTCSELMRRVRSHDVGSAMFLHSPDPKGPSVMFTRVIFGSNHTTAMFGYSPAFGSLGLEAWSLTMKRNPDGHWKLIEWKLEMES